MSITLQMIRRIFIYIEFNMFHCIYLIMQLFSLYKIIMRIQYKNLLLP